MGQLLFAANVFVLVLVIGESRLLIPDWLHVFGRLHPLLLHFPIVLLLLAVLLLALPDLLRNREDSAEYGANMLLLGALTAAFTVLAGLLLSHEEGYDREALVWHKWTGLGVFWGASLLYLFLEEAGAPVLRAGAAVLALTVVLSGHFGAAVTHGEDFITAPLVRDRGVNVSLEEAEVFSHVVMPILQNKCVSCHRGSKQKGELRLDGPQYIQKGGESGPVLEPGDVDNSLMIQRIHLPLEDDDHMPPKGKPQLTDGEKAILEAWIAGGADYDRKITAMEDTSLIYQLAVEKFSSKPVVYDFKAADAKTVGSMNSFYRKVQPLGSASPALSVSYFGKAVFDPASLRELKDIYEQTVSLNLNNMPMDDEGMVYLEPFFNLETLYLNFAEIRGEGLGFLSGMKNLRLLSLSGNPLGKEAVEGLARLKNLKHLYIWNTGLDQNDVDRIREYLPGTRIETGYKDDGTLYTLNPPVIKFDKAFFRDKTEVRISHPVQGARIYYTLDGTEPDSTNFLLYEGPLEITENRTLKARAFAPGWMGSGTAEAEFIRSEIGPAGFVLNYPPEDRYKGDGANSLFDRDKAVPDVWNLNWLGFLNNPMDVEMEFEQPTDIHYMALSIWHNVGARFFPPEQVEIWTKKDGGDWILAKKHRPEPPAKDDKAQLRQVEIPFSARGVEKMRVIANPVSSLPSWHGGAGSRAWLMVDELVLN